MLRFRRIIGGFAIAVTHVVCAPSAGNPQNCPSGISMREVKALADSAPQDGAATATSLHPAIARLAANVAKTYACKGMINYYAAKLGLPDDIVEGSPKKIHDALVVEFRNKQHGDENICGTIRYEVPLGLPGHDAETNIGSWLNRAIRPFKKGVATANENTAYKALSEDMRNHHVKMEGQISTEISNLIAPYVPSGRDLPLPRNDYLVSIVRSFQQQIGASFKALVEKQKWNIAEVERFVGVSECSIVLPTATGPDEKRLETYPSAFASYKRLKSFLDDALK